MAPSDMLLPIGIVNNYNNNIVTAGAGETLGLNENMNADPSVDTSVNTFVNTSVNTSVSGDGERITHFHGLPVFYSDSISTTATSNGTTSTINNGNGNGTHEMNNIVIIAAAVALTAIYELLM